MKSQIAQNTLLKIGGGQMYVLLAMLLVMVA